ncbi:sn-glycerol-3-phosphate ABC transporter permease UgpE [Escherichia coli]|nr:sn-glycerol-3-phosphate ABC transporter permease UgpE [Escherichia coli]EFC2872567.1 sn-glycerol-3-phosphate ABC transporter permease UgpE [Escherichia coli]EFD4286559.1 sn-glycerol-3-phosphate ABC transporter permease UgpE [Escherichia coli]EGE4731374.1 sn-glycerol-3-phosphate ABC transporter permease UgpE [Escherichia coli]
MIENRPWLTIFSHTMLILGIAVILFPLYVAFVAATLDKQAVYAAPMTLIPGTHLLENIHNIWVNGVGTNSAPFWRMLLNSFVMAFSITLGKITVSMLSAFAIVWFRFPLRNLFFWMIFITLMLPVEVRIFPTVEVIANLKMLDSYAGLTLPLMASATATFLFRQFFMTLPDELVEAARILELDGLLKRRPRELSGGQRQRVAMGRAIVRDPAVFLFDEPLSNLDAKLRVQMRLELQQLHRRLKTTSLYVTHDQVEAMTLAQRVMVMNGGVAEQIGTPVEVYEKPASLFVASFIGSPAMNLLTGRVNNEGTHFELDGGIELPLNGGYRQYAGRKMTLGIRPEHIALSSQAEGGVPLVMDTLEILGADNLAHGRWGEQKLVVRLAHQERPTAGSTLWLHLAENQLHLFDGETGQRV